MGLGLCAIPDGFRGCRSQIQFVNHPYCCSLILATETHLLGQLLLRYSQ